jgi:putative oxidoreductase
MAIFSVLGRYTNFGLLVLRIGVGAMMIVHGYPKLIGGPDKWVKIGSAIGNFGIHSYPGFWGFMAAFSEAIGGLLVLLGLAFRPACLLIMCTMIVASVSHYYRGDDLAAMSHAVELAFVFFGLFFIGPGRFSVDKD